MYDPFGEKRPSRAEEHSAEMEKRQNELVQFLATRKDLPEYNIKTVNMMIRDLAAADETIRRLHTELETYRMRDMDRHMNSEGATSPHRVMPLPEGVRSVEVKF